MGARLRRDGLARDPCRRRERHGRGAKALDDAKAVTTGPTIIVVHSIIGYGAPKKAGTREAHGEPLGPEEIKGAKRFYGWPEDAQFLVPDGVHQRFRRG